MKIFTQQEWDDTPADDIPSHHIFVRAGDGMVLIDTYSGYANLTKEEAIDDL